MKKTALSEEKVRWWKDNWNLIVKIPPLTRKELHEKLLKSETLKESQVFLWNEVLRSEGLAMGHGRQGLVYIGEAGDALDAVSQGTAKVERNGHYGSIKLKNEAID